MPHDHDGDIRSASALLGEEDCPKCGTTMEQVEVEVEGLPIQQLRLCPECYLVTWNDESGFQSRQGVPMKKGFSPDSDPLGSIDRSGRKLPEC